MIPGVAANQVTSLGQVATPEISVSCWTDGVTYYFSYNAKNKDVESVTMYLEVDDSSPDISRGVINPGASTPTYEMNITSNPTTYAQATKTGRTSSTVASTYYNKGYCEFM